MGGQEANKEEEHNRKSRSYYHKGGYHTRRKTRHISGTIPRLLLAHAVDDGGQDLVGVHGQHVRVLREGRGASECLLAWVTPSESCPEANMPTAQLGRSQTLVYPSSLWGQDRPHLLRCSQDASIPYDPLRRLGNV